MARSFCDEPDVTKVSAEAIRVLHSMRGPADSWLLGAFLVLFGVAVAAALPSISVSIRGAMADGAKGTPGDAQAEHRATVRVRLHIARLVQANAAGGNDFLAESAVVAPVRIADARLLPRLADLAQRIEERGFSARAPPLV